jgi:hypothetical protein
MNAGPYIGSFQTLTTLDVVKTASRVMFLFSICVDGMRSIGSYLSRKFLAIYLSQWPDLPMFVTTLISIQFRHQMAWVIFKTQHPSKIHNITISEFLERIIGG